MIAGADGFMNTRIYGASMNFRGKSDTADTDPADTQPPDDELEDSEFDGEPHTAGPTTIRTSS